MGNKLKVINGLKDISLKQYCEILVELQKNNEAENPIKSKETFIYNVVSIINPTIGLYMLKKIPQKQVNSYFNRVITMFSTKFEKMDVTTVTVNKIECGLTPDLASMEFGAYMDIMSLSQDKKLENFLLIFAILVRPLSSKSKALPREAKRKMMYELESYEDELPNSILDRSERMGDELSGQFARDILGGFFLNRTKSKKRTLKTYHPNLVHKVK